MVIVRSFFREPEPQRSDLAASRAGNIQIKRFGLDVLKFEFLLYFCFGVCSSHQGNTINYNTKFRNWLLFHKKVLWIFDFWVIIGNRIFEKRNRQFTSVFERRTMKLDFGMIVIIAAVLFFYVKLMNQQRVKWVEEKQKKKRQAEGKGKKSELDNPAPDPRMWLSNLSWKDSFFIILSTLLMLLGSLERSGYPLPDLQPFWWVFASGGVILLSFSLKL